MSNKKKSWKVFKVIGITFVTILIVSLLGVGLWINWWLSKIDYDPADQTYTLLPETPDPNYDVDGTFDADPKHYSGAPQFSWQPVINKKIINILLIGADKRPTQSDSGRSDTIIIATWDKEHKKIKFTSIMRDTYVFIPNGYRDNRINDAYSRGGPQFLMETINANFNTSLSKYVVVDFDAFKKVVDIIGGVDIEMNSAEVEYFKTKMRHLGPEVNNLKVGMNNLNGSIALEYARLRKVGKWDYERTDRQRRLLTSVYKKAMSQGKTKLLSVAGEILDHVTTNISKGDIFNLILDAITSGKMDVVDMRIPYKNTFTEETRRGMSVLVPDIHANAEKIRDFIYYDKY